MNTNKNTPAILTRSQARALGTVGILANHGRSLTRGHANARRCMTGFNGRTLDALVRLGLLDGPTAEQGAHPADTYDLTTAGKAWLGHTSAVQS